MKYLSMASCLVFSFMLAACATPRLDPSVAAANRSYFPQSITVNKSDTFVAGLSGFRGGTPEELSNDFAAEIQSGLSKDLPGVMRGQSPAYVSVELTSIEVGPSVFAARTVVANGTVIIVDAASGATVAQVAIRVDNSEMRNATNKDPLAALVGNAILKTAVRTRNLGLWNLAGVFRWQVKKQLGGRAFF